MAYYFIKKSPKHVKIWYLRWFDNCKRTEVKAVQNLSKHMYNWTKFTKWLDYVILDSPFIWEVYYKRRKASQHGITEHTKKTKSLREVFNGFRD